MVGFEDGRNALIIANAAYESFESGKVIDIKVKVGSKVKKGDTLVILEAMKMEHQVKAIEDEKVTQVLIKKDDQLENGALLMIVD